MLERQLPHQHRVQRDPHRPYINLPTIVSFSQNHFRGSVTWRPTWGLHQSLGLCPLGTQTEVNQFQVIAIDDDVFWFDVSVGDLLRVEELYGL